MLWRRTCLLKMALVALGLLAGNTACSAGQTSPAATERPTQALTPYQTLRPSPTLTAATLAVRVPTAMPTPTPTPITYQIVEGDTLLGIALKFGISLEALQAANPEVDARILSVGTVLIIPLGESNPVDPPAPTPVPIRLATPLCYPSAEGGAWCFVQVTNQRNKSIENLSAGVSLFSADGELAADGIASIPLNLLRPEESLPMVIYFGPPVPVDLIAQAHLLTALPVSQERERYLKAAVDLDEVQIAPGGEQATVVGVISLPKKSEPASRIWLAVVAYGAGGQPVGIRKWEAPGNLEPGKSMPFELAVYSLGPSIQRVEVLPEARP